MKEMINYIQQQIIMVSVFLMWAYSAQFINMLLGAWINKNKFEFRKFISGFYDPIWIYIITISVVSMVSSLPFLLKEYGILNVDLSGLEAFTGVAVALLAVRYGIDRLNDVYTKTREKIGIKEVSIVYEEDGLG